MELCPEEKQEGKGDGIALSRVQESKGMAALAWLVLLKPPIPVFHGFKTSVPTLPAKILLCPGLSPS